MKFMISLLTAALPLASFAQSQSGGAPGVPSVAIPKTTEVLVIQTGSFAGGVSPACLIFARGTRPVTR